MDVCQEKMKVLFSPAHLGYDDVDFFMVAYKKVDKWFCTLVATFKPESLFEDLVIRDKKIKLTSVCYQECDTNLVNDIIQWYHCLTEDEFYHNFAISKRDGEDISKYLEPCIGKYVLSECSCDYDFNYVCLPCNFESWSYDIFNDKNYRPIRSLVVETLLEKMKETPFKPFG